MRKWAYRFKKGISMAELALSLAVITIVSAAAVTVVVSSSETEASVTENREILTYAENAVECFRFADSEQELLSALQYTEEAYTLSDHIYFLDNDTYKVSVQTDFTAGTLYFKAYTTGGEVLYETSYEKG